MAKKNYYYILVMTNYGPVFVTGTGEHNTAYWNYKKAPKDYAKGYAEEIVFGLTVNGYLAFLVQRPRKIESQPYLYDSGEFVWQWNDKPTMKDVIGWISEHDGVYEDFKQRFPKLCEEDN